MAIFGENLNGFEYRTMNHPEDLSLKEFYQCTVHQIEIEINLINNRLLWMLTFQGFLFTAIALTSNQAADPNLRKIFKNVIPYFGIVVALLALIGVFGAYLAIENLREDWKQKLGLFA